MSDDIATYVRENQDIIAGVLRYSQDPYARACALVLLTHGGSERDVEAIKEEVERCA
jgi:hypothetical protein